MVKIECHSSQYMTKKVTYEDGVVHLHDYLSSGFPLCGSTKAPSKEAAPVKECGYCIEAAERWLNTLKYYESQGISEVA